MKKNTLRSTCSHLAVIAGLGLLIPAALGMISCERSTPEQVLARQIKAHCRYDVNQFLLEKLQQNRVVMLADFAHGNARSLQTLIGFLDYWLKQVEKEPAGDTALPRRITLVLEIDSLYAEVLQRFFGSGDIRDLLGPEHIVAEQYTSAAVEYYYDLRDILRRVAEDSRRAANTRRIALKIIGPETVLQLDTWSVEQRDEFFINERDQLLALRIINRLEQHPAERALVFYGAAHLNPERTIKHGQLREGPGHFMAHYLAQRFAGDGGVYRLYQLVPTGDHHLSPAWAAPGRTYAIDNSAAPLSVPDSLDGRLLPEGSIVHFTRPRRAVSLSRIWSANLAGILVDNLELFAIPESDILLQTFSGALRYLTVFTGRPVEALNWRDRDALEKQVQLWRRWQETYDGNTVDDIIQLTIWRRLIEHMASASDSLCNIYETLLAEALGARPRYDTLSTPQQRAALYQQLLVDNREQIITDNLVQLLWVGTAEEKQRAQRELQTLTGQQLATPKQWMLWWRNTGY